LRAQKILEYKSVQKILQKLFNFELFSQSDKKHIIIIVSYVNIHTVLNIIEIFFLIKFMCCLGTYINCDIMSFQLSFAAAAKNQC